MLSLRLWRFHKISGSINQHFWKHQQNSQIIYLYVAKRNFLMLKLVLEKAEETKIKLPTSAGSSKKQESSRKTSNFCFIDYAKAFDCVDHNQQWKILKGMGIPDYLTCLLRNLYAGQEATARTRHVTTDWFQIRKRRTSRLYIVTLLI